jgi:hypothetical protein
MKELVCEFSVGYDKEIEEVVMYDEENFTEERMTEFIEKMIREKQLRVGERCEGSIYSESRSDVIGGIMRNDIEVFIVEYRWCKNVGEDWKDDSWVDEQMVFFQEW